MGWFTLARWSRRFAAVVAAAAGSWASAPCLGAAGDVVKTYDWGAHAFVTHPSRPIMYATLPDQNSVAIIDTNTLAVRNTVFIGSNPSGMALSTDGSRLYVANSGSNFVGVLDTATETTLDALLMPSRPSDIEFGLNNRLFVLSGGIMQRDATTGASAGPNLPNVSTYSGAMEISPDKRTLYYGQYGLSPTSLYKIDVSTTTPPSPTSLTTGSNGQDLTLSHDGAFIAHPNGAPYAISLYRTSDMVSLGTLNTGAYPREIAFSPDDQVAYAVHTSGEIDIFSTKTFLPRGRFTGSGEAGELSVDASGRYLFASFGGTIGTRVYDTGRANPGDVNRDGGVNGSDFAILAANFGKSGMQWTNGDFTMDGTINGSDFALLAANFGKSWTGGPAPALTASDWAALEAYGSSIGVQVPEPSAAGVLAAAAGLLCRRRRLST
jgi:YVTN family beta-propeller protein